MAKGDPQVPRSEAREPSPLHLVFWTLVGALSGLGFYRGANDIVMGRSSLPDVLLAAGTLIVALFAIRRLARLLS